MSRRLILIILVSALAAAITVTLLFAAGINPIWILIGAMAGSVVVRAVARRK